MSHTNLSQLPASRLQRKLPTEAAWNVGSGEDAASDPPANLTFGSFQWKSSVCLSAQNRMPPLAAGCQSHASGLGARRTSANHTPFGASVSPLKAHLASTWSAVLWCGRSHPPLPGLGPLLYVLGLCYFANRLIRDAEPWQGLPFRIVSGASGENPSIL